MPSNRHRPSAAWFCECVYLSVKIKSVSDGGRSAQLPNISIHKNVVVANQCPCASHCVQASAPKKKRQQQQQRENRRKKIAAHKQKKCILHTGTDTGTWPSIRPICIIQNRRSRFACTKHRQCHLVEMRADQSAGRQKKKESITFIFVMQSNSRSLTCI